MPDIDLTPEVLASVAGASVAVSILVQAIKMITRPFGWWRPALGEPLCVILGMVILPVFAVSQTGFDAALFTTTVIVGAQAGIAASAGFQAGSDLVDALRS